MTFSGHIHDGVVVFDQPPLLPEGAAVSVRAAPVPVNGERDETTQPPSSIATIRERYKNFIGTATELPEDMAENHDHYLHGTPKR